MPEAHDKLVFLLLEGVLGEMEIGGGGGGPTMDQYRRKLWRFLEWEGAKYDGGSVLEFLPKTFFREKALTLCKVGSQLEGMRVFVEDLKDVESAVEYCDRCYERTRNDDQPSCPYLPLFEVMVELGRVDEVIPIMRRKEEVIDQAGAVRLLPTDMHVDGLVKDFLGEAVRRGEAKVRQLTVVSALMRQRYNELHTKLNDAHIRSQSTLSRVLELNRLNMGELSRSSKVIRVEPINGGGSFPFTVTITKHSFPRFLVLQVRPQERATSQAKSLRVACAKRARSVREACAKRARVSPFFKTSVY